MLEVTMINMRALILIAVCQIFLSIYLILNRKNKAAIFSEIATSVLLFAILNNFTIDVNNICWITVVAALAEYFTVKCLLVLFMWVARVYSFYKIKKVCNKRKKISKSKLKIINKFNRVNYWPRLKLGIPSKAGKMNSKTKVKFDSKGFPKFKSYYMVKLRRKDYRKTREQHFYLANKILYKNILSNARLKAKFSKKQISQLSNGETPNKYTWHHHQDAGVLQLVEYTIHSKTPHIGGYSIWGKK